MQVQAALAFFYGGRIMGRLGCDACLRRSGHMGCEVSTKENRARWRNCRDLCRDSKLSVCCVACSCRKARKTSLWTGPHGIAKILRVRVPAILKKTNFAAQNGAVLYGWSHPSARKEGENGDKKWAIVNKHCGPSCSQHAARGLYSLC